MPVEMFQEPDGVVAGGVDPGLGPGGVLAEADRADAEWAVIRPLLPVPAWLEGRGGQRRATATGR